MSEFSRWVNRKEEDQGKGLNLWKIFGKCHFFVYVLLNLSLVQLNNGMDVELQWCGQEETGTEQPMEKNWTVPAAISADLSQFTVSLVERPIKCSTGVFEVNLTWSHEENRKLSSEREQLFSDGYLQLKQTDFEYFHPQEYCISEITEDYVSIKYCQRSADVKVSNIPKCCPMSYIFTLRATNTSKASAGCESPQTGSAPFQPVLYKNIDTQSKGRPVIHFQRKRSVTFNCFKKSRPLVTPHAPNPYAKEVYGLNELCYKIREDGTLMYLDNNYNWNQMSRDHYCLDGIQTDHQVFKAQEGDFAIVACAIPQHDSPLRNVMYGCVLIISSVFLLLTFIVYLLWNQKNLHGWTTLSYTSSMFFMYLFLGTANLLLHTMGHEVTGTLGCKTLAILAHFFFLSTFCWLTVRSFDLFWTFRGMKARNQRSKGLKRFAMYAAFGWGFPFVFVTASVIIDSMYSTRLCNTVVVPFYGLVNCYLKEESFGYYLYYPIGILLSLNLLFVALTTYKLYVYKKETRMATKDMHNERQQMFKVFIKLFFVMGVSWIFEFVSWWHVGNSLTWYWAIVDFINLLQGAAIFIIFVCKADIMRSLKTQYPSLRPILNPLALCLRCHTADLESSATMMTSTPSIHGRMSVKQ